MPCKRIRRTNEWELAHSMPKRKIRRIVAARSRSRVMLTQNARNSRINTKPKRAWRESGESPDQCGEPLPPAWKRSGCWLNSPLVNHDIFVAEHEDLRVPGFRISLAHFCEAHDREPVAWFSQEGGCPIEDDIA